MKKIKPVILLLAITVLISCSDGSYSTFRNYPEAKESFTSGKWHLSSHTKNGKEERETYKDYKFNFNTNNTIVAYQNKKKIMGKWSVNSDWGTDDNPPADFDFVIEFKTSDILSHLNGDYWIVERTLSKLKLKNTNSSDKYCEYLEFEKDI